MKLKFQLNTIESKEAVSNEIITIIGKFPVLLKF